MKHLTGIVLLFFAAASIAQEIPESWPDWLRDAMAREQATEAMENYSIADGAVAGKLRGTFVNGPERDEDDDWYFALDISAESPMECWVFPTGADTATATAAIADNLVNHHAANMGGLGSKNLYHASLQFHDGVPVLALEWLYNAGKEGEQRIGLVKVRSALTGNTNIVCAHSAMGYRESFADAFGYLLSNLSVQRPQDPYYESLHAMTVNGASIGFARVSMFEDAQGDTEIRSAEAMLMPADAASVSTSDTVGIEYSYPDGRLINQVVYSLENGNVVVSAQMQPAEGGWLVSGTAQGKDIETTIETEHVVLTSLGQMQQTKALLQAEEGGDVEFHLWVPSVDPVGLTAAVVTVASDASGTLTTGPVVFDTQFDENGNLESGQTDLGGIAMVIRKVWAHGTLRK